MKNRFYLITALALTSAILGCQREPVVNNPNYDPATETVVTDLVLNISTSPSSTKQSAAETQAVPGSTFLGLGEGYLQPIIDPANPDKVLASDMNAADNIKLSDILGYNDIAQPATGTNTSRRVMQVSLPLQTNKLLFYGRGMAGPAPNPSAYGSISNVTSYDAYGHLERYTISANQSSCDFALGRRLAEDNNITIFYREERLLAAILTAIMNTSVSTVNITATDTPEEYITAQYPPAYGYAISWNGSGKTHPVISWADYDNRQTNNSDDFSPYDKYIVHAENPDAAADVPQSPLEKRLANLYKQMTDIRTAQGELRAGAGDALVRTIADLWSGLNNIRWATPSSASDALAKYIANAAFLHINDYFKAASDCGTDGAAMTNVGFQTLTTILSKIQSDTFYSSITYPTNEDNVNKQALFQLTAEDCTALGTAKVGGVSVSLIDFPFAFHLPRGGTHIAFDKTNKFFYYPRSFNVSGMQGLPQEGTIYNAESYYFPAELLYFGNGAIRTSTTAHTTNEYPNGTAAWINSTNWSADWTGNTVNAATKSVALKTNINYGVAMLQTQVKYDLTSSGGVLHDNNHAIQVLVHGETAATNEQDKDITPTDASFKLTGILIGGQPANVGWDYLPVGEPITDDQNNITGYTATVKDGFVYDRAIHTEAQSIPVSGVSNPNYTVLFDNFKGTQTNGIWVPAGEQAVVNVALEFLNNTGEDFYGNYNLIPAGGYFYLIGTLNPNTTMPDPTDSQAPHVANPNQPSYGDKTRDTFLDRTDGYVVPPYAADGSSQKVPRVFIQDYITKVTFVLGPNSLKSAYLTVPDLRATTMSIGLSVDMSWQTGLEFNNVILGQ